MGVGHFVRRGAAPGVGGRWGKRKPNFHCGTSFTTEASTAISKTVGGNESRAKGRLGGRGPQAVGVGASGACLF